MKSPSRKPLRPYQARLITDVCRSTGHILVEQPTGAGKTLQIVTLVAMQLGKRFTHAVIAAPQQQIEHGFVHPDCQLVAFPGSAGVATPDIEVPVGLIWGARQSELGSVKRLLAYLRQLGPLDHALACTHAALNRLSPEKLPTDLSGKALFVDEAHHASADGLSQIVAVWQERGGQLYFFTATPYRGDGRPVALDGMCLYRRSLAEHMAEGFAPRQLECEIVALGHQGDRISAAQFTGEEAPPASYFDELMQAICRRWTEDGRPKAIVRIPPMRGGSEGLVNRLIQALTCEGARVLDATGTGVRDKERFLAALEAEKNVSHADSRYDVMVGIQRVLEGTDWPVCSTVYCVGMPGSLNTVVQLLGRAMRPKSDDYPSSHREQARLVFFVPCGGGSALADLAIDHSRHALLTCCFLADHEVGQEWIVLREVRRGIEDALGPRDENPAAADAENEANVALDLEVRAELELVMASAREQIITEGGEPTLGEVVQLAAKTRPDLPEAALHRVAAEILASQPGSSGTEAREAIHKEVAKRLRIDPVVKKAMEEAFAVVLDEFRAATLKGSIVLERVGRQVHGITGGQMREFAQRLRDAVPPPLTEEQILAWADAHKAATGEWPKKDSGQVAGSDETWAGINMALYKGLRGLPGGSSLAKLLTERRDVRNHMDLQPLTILQILAWADAHRAATGDWPKKHSGQATGTDETWSGIDNALARGNRGLSGGSSLAKLLAEHRDVRNIQDLPPLSAEQILIWVDAYKAVMGDWPGQKSGQVAGTDETWSGIDTALYAGARGLPGGSSLGKLLAEHRDVRNHMNLPPLTIEQILGWADAHKAATGDWPRKNSGQVIGTNETWLKVHDSLQAGQRGLLGGSTLARLLAEHRGVRNRKGLPPLTIEQILVWADAHRAATGDWPRKDSGQVSGAEETWLGLDFSLKRGRRGLPSRSTLAQLLAEHRSVRNIMDLPPLTVEQILTWADAHKAATGDWPAQGSGQVTGTDEKWVGIDESLRTGRRGLPGGSSLALLLAENGRKRNRKNLPELTIQQVLAWSDAYYATNENWPSVQSGQVTGTEETWSGINAALSRGNRGLPGGSSLARLIKEHRNLAVS